MSLKRIQIRQELNAGLSSKYTMPVLSDRTPDLSKNNSAITLSIEEGETESEGMKNMTMALLNVGFHSKEFISDDDLDLMAKDVGDYLNEIVRGSPVIIGIQPSGFAYESGGENEHYSLINSYNIYYRE